MSKTFSIVSMLLAAIGLIAAGCNSADRPPDSEEPQETAGKSDSVVPTAPGIIEGYTDHTSVVPGGQLQVMVSTEAPTFSVELMRFGAQLELVGGAQDIPGHLQSIPADAYRVGAQWQPSYTVDIPADAVSGFYAIRLYAAEGDEFLIPFIVREQNPGTTAKLAILASDFTWQAYNCWGGASYYRCGCWENPIPLECGTDRFKQKLSLDRPMIGNDPREDASHLSGGDKFIVQWAEANGYEYAMLAESDLQAAPSVLNAYDTLIINVHSEYWTTQMYDGLDQFLAQGGNLLYLGGNAIHWKVTFEGREMEVRKDRGRHDHSGERGGLWRELQRNSVGTLGLEFDIAAVSAGTNAPFEVVEASHWVFEGANVAPGDRFGGQGANHRDDQEPGASGWELDVFNDQSPPGAVHLARGTNPVRPEFVDRYDEGVPGDIIYWDHPGGGGAFAAGSITFTGSLMVDDTMSTMLNNVLERFGH